MSNLCQEITLPTKPLQHIDDESGEIALCILSAINVGKIRDLEDLMFFVILLFGVLMNLLIFKGIQLEQQKSQPEHVSLGIGFIGLAHYIAKNGTVYDDPETWKLVHDLTEAFQYYLIRATVNLAKEKGACEYSNRTKYGNGILPIDTYKKDVDEIVSNGFTMIGRVLETMSFNMEYGTQHCPHKCLQRAVPLCQMPQMESNLPEGTCPLRSPKRTS